MLPRKLTLQNFLSYGAEPQTLDFAAFDLAVVMGANGVGKSSLLEAYTWAVWGQARGASDNDLIHQGARAMYVEAELESRGRLFRIIRKRAVKGRGGTTSLEFQTLEDDDWRPLTAPTIRETQEAIDKALGLTYETFVNSAYLRQGRADEFTVKRPSERKALLGEILGLGTYDALEDAARTRMRELERRTGGTLFHVEQLEKETAELPSIRLTLAQDEEELSGAKAQLEKVETDVNRVRGERETLLTRRERGEAARKEAESCENEIGTLEREIRTLDEKIAAVEGLLATAPELKARAEDAVKAQRLLDLLNEKLAKANEIQLALHAATTELAALDASSAAERAAIEGDIARIKTAEKELPAQEKERARLAGLLAKAEEELASFHEEEKRRIGLEEERKHLTKELESLKERAEKEKARLDTLKENAECPLCEQPLGAEHQHRIAASVEATIAELRGAYKSAADRRKELDALLAAPPSRTADLEASVGMMRTRISTINALRERVVAERANLPSLTARLAALEDPASAEKRKELQKTARTAQRKLTMLGYDAEKHADARAEAEKFKVVLERLQELGVAEQQRDLYAAQRTTVLERLEMKRKRNGELAAETLELGRIEEALTLVEQTLVEHVGLLDSLRETAHTVGQRVAALRQQRTTLETKETELAQLKSEITKAREEQSLLADLVQAFGRNGIPAMLIESAIPEIEEESNRILGRMSGNQMHLRLDLTKEKRSGEGSIETLEIRIGDLAGTRDYEMYSGGEAFRINFALRIALSKLLARRAGTELRFLLIDEGFGTQDAIGRDTIVAILNAIKEDFEKILVITHIQELKDVFNFEIRIEKRGDASYILTNG